MRRLAFDTSSVACTVALQFDERLVERHEEQPREHTRLLMPMIRSVLQEAGVDLRDLDAIVLGNGPGSFIGMRIAASVAQGLAHGAGLKIVPVSSLAAVAGQVLQETDAQEVAVAQDAHMNEVYLGIFSRDHEGLPCPMAAERLLRQEMIAELDASGMMRRIAAGYGWQRYPNLMSLNRKLFCRESNIIYPRAQFLLSLSAKAAAVAPEDIDPAYLRKKVAEMPG